MPDDDIKFYDFVSTLIQAMIGYSLDKIPKELHEEIIQSCLDAFTDFIISFVSAKYDKKDVIRLKASQQFAGQEIFSKFTDLGHKFDEAFEAFKLSLSVSWSDQKQAA